VSDGEIVAGEPLRAVLVAAAVLIAATLPAAAQDATWNLNGTGDYNTNGNWTPSVPGAFGTAFFGVSNQNAVTFSGVIDVGGWTFNAGASSYTFNNGNFAVIFLGAGIVVNGGSAAITNNNALEFLDSSTAGSAAITNNRVIEFLNTSTAGNAAITNTGPGSEVFFSGSTGPNNDHKLSAGSIAGGGSFILGANQLTVGGNNLSTVVSGVIEDSSAPSAGGALVKIGTGTLTLTGTNAYTGGTTVNGGTLQIGNGATTGSITGDVIDNATLAFNHSNTVTFGGAISGSGALQQMGPGTLVLTGTESYTGATTVNGGTLEVDTSIATSSLTTVNSGAALAGTGTVSATQVNHGGTLAPGSAANPTGTLNITGNLAFASGAIYMVQISPTAAAMANVSGAATLNGTLAAVFAPGTYLTRRYDVLHAAAVNGTFAAVTGTNTPTGLFNLVYTATDVFLDFIATIGGDGTPLNGNQQAVASSINNFLNSGGALPPGFVPLFTLGGTSLQTELSHLDGEAAADAQKGSFALMTEILSLMLDPFVDGRSGSSGTGATPFAPEQQASFPPDIALAYDAVLKAPPKQNVDQRWTAWGAGFGGYNKTNGDPTAGSNTVTAHDFGFAAGMDYHFLPNSLVGFSLAGGGTTWGLAQGLGGGRSDAFSGGLYAKTRSGPWYVAAALAVADQWFSTSRTAAFGDQLTARFNGQSVGGRVEAGYRYAVAPMIGVTPYAALQAQSFHTPRHSETDVTAGGFGLTYNDMSASDTRSELGARFDDLTMLGAMPLVLRARAAWAHDAVSNPALGAVFQALPGAGFIVNGAAPPKNSALASAGAELRMTRNWSLAAKLDGEFASRAQTYAGTGTLRYAW
jgi:autotransporter-associated beta strand protein